MKSTTQSLPSSGSLGRLRKARYCLADDSFIKDTKDVPQVLQTKSCQTAYRESDAQTSPWFPPFTTAQKKTPEAVLFSTLPIESTCLDKHDIEIVQRNRKFQEWEKYLATIPPNNIELRKAIIMKIEQDKWNFREKEFDEENQRRLEEARKEIDQQRAIVRERINWRSNNAKEKWEKQNSLILPRIKSKLDRDLRRINVKMQKPRFPDRIFKNEPIDQYYSGQLTLPPARLGKNPKKNYEVLCKAAYPTSMKDAYLLLETSLEHPQKKSGEVVHRKIKKHDCEKSAQKRLYHHVPEKIPDHDSSAHGTDDQQRYETNVYESPLKDSEEELQYQRDVKLLQCLIRGRAVQNMMFRAYKSNLGLISEMSLSVPLKKEDEDALEQARIDNLGGIRDHNYDLLKKEKIGSVIGHLQGYTIAETLDFASKELLRQEEHSRLLALAEVAEKDRRIREGAEAGRRQEEQQRQKQHEEIYKEAMKTHEITTDVLLDQVLKDQVVDTGRGLATIMTRKVADIYDQVVPKPGPDPYEKLEYVSLLADRCLETQFESEQIKQKKDQKDMRFKEVAHNMLSTLKRDLDEDYSTESVDTFESAYEDITQNKNGDTDEITRNKNGDTDEIAQNKNGDTDEIARNKNGDADGIARNKNGDADEITRNKNGDADEITQNKNRDNRTADKIGAYSTISPPKLRIDVKNEESRKEKINLIVENDDDSDLVIGNNELDSTNESAIRKLLEYVYRQENDDPELEDRSTMKKLAEGDEKTLKKYFYDQEREVLKKFLEKPSLLFEKSSSDSEMSRSQESDSDKAAEERSQKALKNRRRKKPLIIETEEQFREKCLEKKADKVLTEILKIAEKYIVKYEAASKKDGYTLEALQKSYGDAMTEAYKILSIILLKSSDHISKTELNKHLKPWINTILNEATKRMRNMFTSLVTEEVEDEVPDEDDVEEELIEPEEIDKMIEDLTTPRLSKVKEAIPGNHIFSSSNFYSCPQEEEEEEEHTVDAESDIGKESESDIDDDTEMRYVGVLDEKITEMSLLPEERSLNKLLRVVKDQPFDYNNV